MFYVSICAIVKDEDNYLNEWISYHLQLGIDHFIIYDNNSHVPIRTTLAQYVDAKVVEVIEFPQNNGQQLMAYNDCLYKFGKQTRWIAFIDVDEFIDLNRDNNIRDFLKKYENYAGVCLNWLVYNANGHVEKQSKSVIETFTRAIPKEDPINMHIKTIVQPAKVESMANAHWAKCSGGNIQVNELFHPVLKGYANFTNEFAFIRHYYTRSYEEWAAKLKRGCVATATTQKPEHLFWLYNPDLINQKANVQKKYLGHIQQYLTMNDLYNQTKASWTIIIDKRRIQILEKEIKSIARFFIDDQVPMVSQTGLYEGKSGIALFLYNYFRHDCREIYEEKAAQYLSLDLAEIELDHSISNGISGVGWLIEYLSQNQYIDFNTNEYFRLTDELFSQSIKKNDEISLSSGLISYGIYFVSRMSSLSYSPGYTHNVYNGITNLKKITARLNALLTGIYSGNIEIKRGDFTVLNSYSGVILFLLKMCKLNISKTRSSKTVRRLIKSLLSANDSLRNDPDNKENCLQWDQSELATANILIQASLILDDISLYDIACKLITDSLAITDMTDNIFAVINYLHIYRRLYQQLPNSDIKAKIQTYTDRAIILLAQKKHLTSPGLKNGMAGIGLVLLSLITEQEPTWDKIFLTSL